MSDELEIITGYLHQAEKIFEYLYPIEDLKKLAEYSKGCARIIEKQYFYLAQKTAVMASVMLMKKAGCMPDSWNPSFFSMDKDVFEAETGMDYMYDAAETSERILNSVLEENGWEFTIVDLDNTIMDSLELDNDDLYYYPDSLENHIQSIADIRKSIRMGLGEKRYMDYRAYIDGILDLKMNNSIDIGYIYILSHPMLGRVCCNMETYSDIIPEKVRKLFYKLLENIKIPIYPYFEEAEACIHDDDYSVAFYIGSVGDSDERVDFELLSLDALVSFGLLKKFLEHMETTYPVLFMKGGGTDAAAV